MCCNSMDLYLYSFLGASCLDDRIRQVLRSSPGSQPWYERYIRVFCREIFLDKSSDLTEKGFWLCKILKPWPLVFQARLLYILYGPVNDENGKYTTDLLVDKCKVINSPSAKSNC